MPATSRLLYYDFGMAADDDGFCEWFTVLQMSGAKEQDMQVLEANGLVKVFDKDVLVVTDWKENNLIKSDRYTPSKYLSTYSGFQVGTQVEPQVRLGKVSISNTSKIGILPLTIEKITEEKPLKEKKDTSYRAIFSLWGNDYPLHWNKNLTEIEAAKNLLKESSIEDVKWFLGVYEKYKAIPYCPTILKPSDVDRKWDNLIAFKKKHG